MAGQSIPSKPDPGRIVVSGASGMIGTALVRDWVSEGIHPIRLIRGERSASDGSGVESARWDPSATQPLSDADLAKLARTDTVIHLSGENVAGHRWTEAYKRKIVSSRVQSTTALVRTLTSLTPMPRVLVCASAIGIYGDRGDEILTDYAAPGSGFLAETCVAWESAAQPAVDAGIRVVHARFGVVLSRNGGALAKLLPLFRLGLGGNLGDGRAWMPWLTLRDAVGILRFCAENESITGAVNAVSPNPITNAEFTHALAAALHRPAILPAPAFALKLAFGQMANEALLASARVIPQKLLQADYAFADPYIAPALESALR
jgi:uncharacterized protein (TIGR01777 family)